MASPTEHATRPFTVAEYHKMAEAGVLGPDERVELIRGLVVPMSPKNWAHAVASNRLGAILGDRLAGRAGVVMGAGLKLESLLSEPEPDVMVLSTPGLSDAPSEKRLPLLVIEVSRASLHENLGEKAALYASAGVLEYWVVNLAARELVVMREPRDGSYSSRTTHAEDSRVVVLAWPDVEVDVADVLPDPSVEGG